MDTIMDLLAPLAVLPVVIEYPRLVISDSASVNVSVALMLPSFLLPMR